MFTGMSDSPDWFKNRVKLFIALGPVLRMTEVKNGFLH